MTSTPVFRPMIVDGSSTFHAVHGPGVADRNRQEKEADRRERIAINRAYYEGSQYDQDNLSWKLANGHDPKLHMPEHHRLHAYSTHIAECVEFIAGQLTDGMDFSAKDTRVQGIIDSAIMASDRLRNLSDEVVAIDDLMIEAGQAGDVPYQTLWDPVEQAPYWDFWPSEDVEIDAPSGTWIKKVTTHELIIEEQLVAGSTVPVEREIHQKTIYDLAYRPVLSEIDGELVGFAEHLQCRARVFWDEEEDPVDVRWLEFPFIPWGVLKIDKRGLRGFRGDPLITRRAIDSADRYNANEQTAYLIARYNSHGNVVVIGDEAFLQLEAKPSLNKDVADVLKFPGGTAVAALTLPTDPRMIEHTSKVTSDAVYASFGLVRTEPDTLSGLGGVTGYSLEILNRKSEGTFKRIRRTFATDLKLMINQALDVTAYRQPAQLTPEQEELLEEIPGFPVDLLLQPVEFWEIDPQSVFPNREVEIRMGAGYVVDDVQIRDDFTAGLISQEEALRRRGYTDDEISRIIEECKQRREQEREEAVPPVPAGQSIEDAESNLRREVQARGTKAGNTLGSASSRS